jgi:hypothetical protein
VREANSSDVPLLLRRPPIGAAWLDHHRVAFLHDGSLSVAKLDGSVPRPVLAGMANCASVLPLADEIIMTVGGSADIQLNDLQTGRQLLTTSWTGYLEAVLLAAPARAGLTGEAFRKMIEIVVIDPGWRSTPRCAPKRSSCACSRPRRREAIGRGVLLRRGRPDCARKGGLVVGSDLARILSNPGPAFARDPRCRA